MPDKKKAALAILESAGRYLRENPDEVWHALRSALALRASVPLATLRWLAAQPKGKRAPKDVQLEAVPPGIRLSATVDAMGTALRASAAVYVDRVAINPRELRFELRLRDVSLKVLDDKSESPLASLLRSGALDLSKPGNLVGFMPKRPAALVEAQDDRVVIDLKKSPKLQNGRVGRVLDVLTPLLTVQSITSDRGHLDVAFTALPGGATSALSAVRAALEKTLR
jgi:hypothetical protein